jgi:hypothetical protein
MCCESDDIKNETDDPSDLFGGFSPASCHEDLLTFGRLATLLQPDPAMLAFLDVVVAVLH